MTVFRSIGEVVSEIWKNKVRLVRLAFYELKNQYGGTFFGFFWNFMNPVFQIFVYWFVFTIGLRKGNAIDGVPYIVWLVIGIIVWYYISTAMAGSEMSIIQFSDVLQRMKFPMSIVPVKTVAANLISHLGTMVVVLLVVKLGVGHFSGSVWFLPYFIFAGIAFLVAYSIFAASVNVLFRDYHNFMNTILRLLFFISPVMWRMDDTSPAKATYDKIMMVNPFAYIINGYRNTLLYGWNWRDTLYEGIIFWAITITLFALGCVLIQKFRRKFIDAL